MSYDEKLAGRIRRLLSLRSEAVVERRMFGGLCFMVDGAMCCGVLKTELIVRVGPEHHAEALTHRHARPFDFTGRPSRGMVYVAPGGIKTVAQLEEWIRKGLAFAASKHAPAPP
jgi:TfoX/Sxy family transcriptional regulator of competence genes